MEPLVGAFGGYTAHDSDLWTLYSGYMENWMDYSHSHIFTITNPKFFELWANINISLYRSLIAPKDIFIEFLKFFIVFCMFQ